MANLLWRKGFNLYGSQSGLTWKGNQWSSTEPGPQKLCRQMWHAASLWTLITPRHTDCTQESELGVGCWSNELPGARGVQGEAAVPEYLFNQSPVRLGDPAMRTLPFSMIFPWIQPKEGKDLFVYPECVFFFEAPGSFVFVSVYCCLPFSPGAIFPHLSSSR